MQNKLLNVWKHNLNPQEKPSYTFDGKVRKQIDKTKQETSKVTKLHIGEMTMFDGLQEGENYSGYRIDLLRTSQNKTSYYDLHNLSNTSSIEFYDGEQKLDIPQDILDNIATYMREEDILCDYYYAGIFEGLKHPKIEQSNIAKSSGFNCFEFAFFVAGRKYDFDEVVRQIYDEANFMESEPNVGDIVILGHCQKNEKGQIKFDIYHSHAILYIGNGKYLSKLSTEGAMVVSSLEEFKKMHPHTSLNLVIKK